MVDRNTRGELVELLSCFRDSEINGWSLLVAWPDSHDRAIQEIKREYSILLGASHIYHNDRRSAMTLEELKDRAHITRTLDRTLLFLKTDLEYKWRDRPLLLDPTLLPFQLLSFLITMPFAALALLYLDLEREASPSFIKTAAAILTILALVAGTLIGGSRLRSLITGIDREVWPFYRRKEYKEAVLRGRE